MQFKGETAKIKAATCQMQKNSKIKNCKINERKKMKKKEKTYYENILKIFKKPKT